MRVVLDTNIFVSGIHWTGSSEKILRAWLDNQFELVSSLPRRYFLVGKSNTRESTNCNPF